MAEDFTLYTEVDPNNRITITSTRVSWNSITRNEAAYVTADKGVDRYNGRIEIQCTVSIISGTGSPSGVTNPFWISNNIDSSGAYLGLQANTTSSNAMLILRASGASNDNSINLALNTPYYLTFIRDLAVGTYGTWYCYIYSDAGRTVLVDTLQTTLASHINFQYLHPFKTYNDGGASVQTGYIENLVDLSPISYEPSGGFVVGGTALPAVLTKVHTPSGGFVAGGASPTLKIISFNPSGGFLIGGSAPYESLHAGQRVFSPSGGFVLGGASDAIQSVGFLSSGGFIIGGTAIYVPVYSPSLEYIYFKLKDIAGPITGGAALTLMKLIKEADQTVFDWGSNTFKSSGWISISQQLAEIDATNLAGVYLGSIDLSVLDNNERYSLLLEYTGTPYQEGGASFFVKGGVIVDRYISNNTDVTASTRLAAADYVDHTAAIDARPTLSEIEGSAVLAKEGTLLRALGLCMENHVEDDIVRDASGNKTSFSLYNYNSAAAVGTHVSGGGPGLVARYNATATYDANNRMTFFTVVKA